MTGYAYWGPANSMNPYEPMSEIDEAAYRHDRDIDTDLLISDRKKRNAAFKKHDERFLKKIEKLYGEGKVSWMERNLSYLVGSPFSKTYYATLSKNLR